jgi:dTDP-3-amino-3,4,6-trideoxy-alpha-D-glucose transaminase
VPFLDLGAATAALGPEIRAAIDTVLASGQYILGDSVTQFEAAFAAYCARTSGAPLHAVGVGSGLDALVLALRALDIGPGDEVLVPAQTFVATWMAVSQVGATPVPVDVTENTACMDPTRVEPALTPRTRALMPVHLFGHPADMTALADLAHRHHLALIEDAAQAHGAQWQGQPVGTLPPPDRETLSAAHIAAFSFYPGKNLGALGDGGAVVTTQPALAERIRRLGNYGSAVKYYHQELGTNSRLDPIQAAVLSVKLAHLDAWNTRRAALAARYQAALCHLPGLRLPQAMPEAQPVWHLYVVRHAQRDVLQARLAQRGIHTLIHYPLAPFQQPAYTPLGTCIVSKEAAFPQALDWAKTALSLPMGPHLSLQQQDVVIAALEDIVPCLS